MEMWSIYYCVGISSLPLVGLLLWWWNELWYVCPVKARCSFLRHKIPPGQLGFPLFGELLTYLWYFRILRRPDDFINSKRRKYGNNVGVYKSYLYGSPTVIVCSPSLCKLVMHSTDRFKQQWPTTEVWGHSSVISLQGPRHDMIKSFLLNVINRPEALARMVLQVQPTIITGIQSWSKQGQIKAVTEVKKVTLEHASRYFASLELGPQRLDALMKCISGITQGLRAQPWNFPGTAYYHALKCRKKVIRMLREELEKRKENAKTKKEDRRDLMDRLMQMKDKEGNQLTDEEVLDNVFSSIESSCIGISHMVTWSLYFLAQSPEVLQQLREENMRLSREKQGDFIRYEDIMKLTYTNKVVEETIRLGNLSSFVFRKAIADTELQGYIIPKDWQVILWLRTLQIDPTNFEDPMIFNPDRWNVRPRYGTYLPFGGGPRGCPGSTLARVTIAIYLHYLSVGYKWELVNPNTRINYLPHPQPMGLEICLSII